jgi:hypothetical protein
MKIIIINKKIKICSYHKERKEGVFVSIFYKSKEKHKKFQEPIQD